MISLRVFMLGLILSFNASATDFEVQGVAGKLIYQSDVKPIGSLGSLTQLALTKAFANKLLTEYQGSKEGVLSINQLGSAMEVLSDQNMNAYGWCYTIDGARSDKLSDAYRLSGIEKQIVWFYAYAVYESGKWTDMCVPAKHEPSLEDRQ